MSDTVKNAEAVSGDSGGVEDVKVDVKGTDTGDALNSATSGDGSTTVESLPAATLDNGLPGATTFTPSTSSSVI